MMMRMMPKGRQLHQDIGAAGRAAGGLSKGWGNEIHVKLPYLGANVRAGSEILRGL